MKLDSIIYDVDTLTAALNEQWSTESDSFKAIYPSDTATSIANAFGAYGAMLQYMLVSAIANVYTTTAFSSSAIYQLADTLGNLLHGNSSSVVEVQITKSNFVGTSVVIPANTSFTINNIKFFNPSAILLPAGTATVTGIMLTQGEVLETVKSTSGIANEKFYFSSNFLVDTNYVTVYVNGEEWTTADSFLDYDKNYVIDTSEMNVVVLRTDSDGSTYVKISDGQLGNLPTSGSTIKIEYVVSLGEEGNITEIGKEGTLTNAISVSNGDGSSSDLSVSVVTTSTAYGGYNTQSLDTLRITSPWVFASGERAVRRQDYNAMLQNKCGYLTSAVWGEYEESEYAGGYDAIMMNMVYYTGLKSYQEYPYYYVDTISDKTALLTTANSTNGFSGSFSVKVSSTLNSNNYLLIQDTGAEGLLFINNDEDDKRDSILPIWIADEGVVYTNDADGYDEAPPTQENPITNARSDMGDAYYYQSLWEPTLANPLQIVIDFSEYDDVARSIAALKFQAVSTSIGPFIGAMAMFASNTDPMPSLYNVRNSEYWEQIVDRTTLTNPIGNANENWTDWIPTKCLVSVDDYGAATFNEYKHFVIEIYSCSANTTLDDVLATFGKIKFLFGENASVIDYDNNGLMYLRFPTAGDPGPDGTEAGYITESTMNEDDYPLYSYSTTISGVTEANGYYTGNVLAYRYNDGDSVDLIFTVTVTNVATALYSVKKGTDGALSGDDYLMLSSAGSLDAISVYTHAISAETIATGIIDGGTGYVPDDIVTIDGSDEELKVRVVTINSSGAVTSFVWVNNMLFDQEINGVVDTTLYYANTGSTGSGLQLDIVATNASGIDGVPGNGGTISISSTNNLEVNVAFSGNKVDTASINELDQTIISGFNHFTTYLEFRQPEIQQVNIEAEIGVSDNSTETASIVIQNVKNNIAALFDITPDYMGKGLKVSEIYSAINNTANVEWCRVYSPADNIDVEQNCMLILADSQVTESTT